ncbi:MAG: type IV toxin-antitoxin system AbiEi family antitoxin domain-containing protein [Rhodocyclaceae bacterium]|nr:type IV toxin-antitoxin system AbiEi family antitoxin domain-containing protein [Rhodocyclaceae bacterium]
MGAVAPKAPNQPDWDGLFAVAQAQSGYFTTAQAAQSGYSRPLLHKYLATGKVVRVRRGVYRVVHFPASEHEDIIVLWLWAAQAGVYSHETALALHDLSDALPGKVHLTVPPSWRRRRLRVPAGLVLHFADVSGVDRASYSAVPVTAPLRTLRDCIEANVAADLVRQGILQARRRGLVSAKDDARLVAELVGQRRAVAAR